MSDEKFERELRAANPVAKQTLEALDLADAEASLGRGDRRRAHPRGRVGVPRRAAPPAATLFGR